MKRKTMIALLAVTLCLSACGNKNDVIEESTISTEAPAEAATETGADAETEAETETAAIAEEATTEEIADNSDAEKTTAVVSTTDVLENAPELQVQQVQEVSNETEIGRTECNEQVYANTDSNIRIQPTTKADKVATVKKGTELTRTAVLDNGWSEITYNDTTCYISSKLVSTEQPVVAQQPTAEEQPAPAETGKTDTTATAQASTGETITKDDMTFVCWGQTPNGLNVYHCDWDNVAWPDWLVNAYDSCGITNDMSDYDKCVAINNYICNVVDYAEIGTSTDALTCYCLVTGEAVCSGYAQAFDYLCTMAGINSRVVVGLAGGAHGWNRVMINGTEYWVDVTWNDDSNNAYLMATSLWSDHTFGYIEQ